jgi:hypothetical protein
MKAMAAKARSESRDPVAAQNPSELSGVRVRRDSVIGARLTPPPRATNGELPNWFWGALGCLSVLLVGFAALFVLARAGQLGSLLPEAAPAGTPPAVTAAPPPSPSMAASPSLAAAEPAPGAHAATVTAAPTAAAAPAAPAAAVARVAAEPTAVPSAPDPAAVQIVPIPTSAVPGPPPESAHASAHEHAPSPAPAKAHPNKPAAEPAEKGPSDSQGATTAEPKAPAPARPVSGTAAKPAADESDDDDSPPGQDAVEAALDALSSRVRGCFVKYQIKGTARVRLVATPSGTAESVNVTGEFEDTPTGMCVEAVISGAKLPAFKGSPLRLSQSYQLR